MAKATHQRNPLPIRPLLTPPPTPLLNITPHPTPHHFKTVRASNQDQELNARVIYGCTPYFELHSADRLLIHNLKDELADHEETLGTQKDVDKRLDAIFEKSNKMAMRMCLRAWAKECRLSALAHKRHERKRMQKWFSLWRLNHSEFKAHDEEAANQSAALQRRIANEMMLAQLVQEQEQLMSELPPGEKGRRSSMQQIVSIANGLLSDDLDEVEHMAEEVDEDYESEGANSPVSTVGSPVSGGTVPSFELGENATIKRTLSRASMARIQLRSSISFRGAVSTADVEAQTPAEWAVGGDKTEDEAAAEVALEEEKKKPALIKQGKRKNAKPAISADDSCRLVLSFYEALLAKFLSKHVDDTTEWDTKEFALPVVTREYLVRRYGMKAMATKTLKNLKNMLENSVGNGLSLEKLLEVAKQQIRRPSQGNLGPPDVHSAVESMGRCDLTGPQLCRLMLFYQLQGGDKEEPAAVTADRLRHFMMLLNNLFPSSKDVQQAFVDKKGFPAEVFWIAVKKTYSCSFKLKDAKSKYGPSSQVETELLEDLAALPCTMVDFVKHINLDYMITVGMRYFEKERAARREEWGATSSLTKMQAFIRKSLVKKRVSTQQTSLWMGHYKRFQEASPGFMDAAKFKELVESASVGATKDELIMKLYLTWSDEVDDLRLLELSRQEAALKLQGWLRRVMALTGNAFVDVLKSETEKKKRRQRKQTIVKQVSDRFVGMPDEDDMRQMRRSLMDKEELEKHDDDLEDCARIFADVMTRFGFIIEDTSNRISRLIIEANSLNALKKGGRDARRSRGTFDSEDGGRASSRRPSMAELMLDSL